LDTIVSRHISRTLAIATVFTVLLFSKVFFMGTLTLNPTTALGVETTDNNNSITTTLVNPIINRISDIVYNAAVSPSSSSNYISKQDVEQTVSQIILLTQAKAGQDKAQQFLSHIAEQVALNPKGSVSQSLIRFAQEDDQGRNKLLDQTISAALVTNSPIPTALTIAAVLTIGGATQNTVDTISRYLASSTGIGTEVYQEVLQQMALRISNTDGKYRANDIINYQFPRAVLQANTGQMVQPLSSFAWNLQYGNINAFDEGLTDMTIGILRGNSLQSSLIGVPFAGSNTYGSGIGGSIYAPSSPLGSYGEGYSPPSSLGSETPQQDLRSMDSSSESSSNQGQSNSPLDNGGDSNTPQQDLRSMDSGNDNSFSSGGNNEDSGGGGGGGGGESESSDGGSTPQEDLRSMDSSSP
jgi:uncharacterized membrane protein YgcG